MIKDKETLIKDLVKIYLHLGVGESEETKAVISEELAIKLQALGIGFNDKKMLDKIFKKAMADFKAETLKELIKEKGNKRLVENGGPTTNNDKTS